MCSTCSDGNLRAVCAVAVTTQPSHKLFAYVLELCGRHYIGQPTLLFIQPLVAGCSHMCQATSRAITWAIGTMQLALQMDHNYPAVFIRIANGSYNSAHIVTKYVGKK